MRFYTILISVFLLLLAQGCKKEEDQSGNQVKPGLQEEVILNFARYNIIEDSNKDGIIQPGEKVKVSVYIINSGTGFTKLADHKITVAGTDVIIDTLGKLNTDTLSINREFALCNIDFSVSRNAQPGDTIVFDLLLNDTSGKAHKTKFHIVVQGPAPKPVILQLSNATIIGEDIRTNVSDYSQGLFPNIKIDIGNLTPDLYSKSFKMIIESKDPRYPYRNEINGGLNIMGGGTISFVKGLACFPAPYHNDQEIPFGVKIIDEYNTVSETNFTLKMSHDVGKVTMFNPVYLIGIKDPFGFLLSIDIKNDGLRGVKFDSVDVTSSSPYISNLLPFLSQSELAINETLFQGIKFRGNLSSNCPKGTTITFKVRVVTNGDCESPQVYENMIETVVN